MPAARQQPSWRRSPPARLLIPGAVATALAVAGCGGGNHTPSLKGLPLVPGVHVLSSAKQCDKGANAYCAIELVVRAGSYPNSRSLALAERALLKRHGWTIVNASVGLEYAADSPGNRLRVTYAGAPGELEAIDLGWVKRPRQITLSLSRAIFNHDAAMALLLQLGTTP